MDITQQFINNPQQSMNNAQQFVNNSLQYEDYDDDYCMMMIIIKLM